MRGSISHLTHENVVHHIAWYFGKTLRKLAKNAEDSRTMNHFLPKDFISFWGKHIKEIAVRYLAGLPVQAGENYS